MLATQIAESGGAGLVRRQTPGCSPGSCKLRRRPAPAHHRRPAAAAQVADLLADSNPGLAVLIANLLTTSEVTLTRGQALDELLSALPADIAAGSTVITSKGADFGVALTFFNPLPCTAGYGGTVYRNGLDTSPRHH